MNPEQAGLTPKPKTRFSKIARLLSIGGLAMYLCAMGVIGAFGWAARDMPSTAALWTLDSTPEIVILDRFGREILRQGGAETKPVDLTQTAPALSQALIAIEDKRYQHHIGFDIIGLGRASLENYKAGRVVQGGSTITQQLAKNVFLTKNQTLKRKAQEILLAVWIEHKFSKNEILETYLSRVYFGGGTLGIESGSQRFFNKSSKELSLGESAMLAGILQAPDRLNPLKNRNGSAERTAKVLGELHKQNKISADQYDMAMQVPIEIEPVPVLPHPSAGYFTDWILAQVDTQIGAPKSDITIQTTLDLDAQIAAQTAIASQLTPDTMTGRNAQQAALVAFDGAGGIRAMIGGAEYRHSTFNRAVDARRQPGSAFKPFVYLAAMEAGYSPWDIRVDEPVDIDGWEPGNFSNTFRGEMSLETALARSVNTVAVTINEELGRSRVTALARRLGLPDLKPYASLALGAQELSLLELASAYIPFANWGYGAKGYGLESVYGLNGEVLYARAQLEKTRLIETPSLEHINTMLVSAVNQGTGRAARIAGHDIAGKTGTTNDYRDAWFIGYAPDYVAGVWVGNDDNSQMSQVTGGSLPTRIWQTFMAQVLKDQTASRLPKSKRPTAPSAALPQIAKLSTPKSQNLERLLSAFEDTLPNDEIAGNHGALPGPN